jgi:hypothetical protein
MSRIIGDRREKSALDEMMEVSRQMNEEVAEETRKEEERRAKREAERKSKEDSKGTTLAEVPSVMQPSLGEIIRVCRKLVYKADHEVIEEIYKRYVPNPAYDKTYQNMKGYYRDKVTKNKRIYRIHITERGLTGGLPDSIGRLTALEELDVYEVKLKRLPTLSEILLH